MIKNVPRPYAYVGKHRIKSEPEGEYLALEGLEIVVEAEEDDLILTELGELFVLSCSERN